MDFVHQKETYLAVMIASLERKSELLEQLIELSKVQEILIKTDKIDEEQFNQNIREKDERIKKIQELDEGFDKIYQYLKEELAVNKINYQEDIQKLKDLITDITEKGVQLQTIELKNKNRMEVYFRTKKQEIKGFKLSSQTATSYYKNRTGQEQQKSNFFDIKN